jgi:hypothetical protein
MTENGILGLFTRPSILGYIVSGQISTWSNLFLNGHHARQFLKESFFVIFKSNANAKRS